MQSFTLAELVERQAEGERPYLEFLREASLSVGLYVLPAGGIDPQRPHTEDEVYCVLAGRSRFTAGGEEIEVSPGSVIFVAAEVEHRFHDIAEELRVVVLFAPPEGSRAGNPGSGATGSGE